MLLLVMLKILKTSPLTLTVKSIASSLASQVYFPESSLEGEWMVSLRMRPSDVKVTFSLPSSSSTPSFSQRTSALSRDTSHSRTRGSPKTGSTTLFICAGRASWTGGSEGHSNTVEIMEEGTLEENGPNIENTKHCCLWTITK